MDSPQRIKLAFAIAGWLALLAAVLHTNPSVLGPDEDIPPGDPIYATERPGQASIGSGLVYPAKDSSPPSGAVAGVATATGDDPAGTRPPSGDWSSGAAQRTTAPQRREFIACGYPREADPDSASLFAFIKGQLKSVRACYEFQRKLSPSLRGKVVVEFHIEPTGLVDRVEIEEDTLGSAEVANCIRETIGSWTTPFRPERDVPVEFPFVFTPAT